MSFLCLNEGRINQTLQQVPLDYSEPDGERAAVALIKYPSAYKPGHKNYKGPILFNPGTSDRSGRIGELTNHAFSSKGGPGGSGVALIIAAAPLFGTLLGDEFDLIGFDPRGATDSAYFSLKSSLTSNQVYSSQPHT